MSERVAVIGAGYVGLVSAVGFGQLGHRVTLTEIDPEKARQIAGGESPIHEPGLADALPRLLGDGRLTVTTDNADIVDSRFVLLALPTPPLADGRADTSQIEGVLGELGSILDDRIVVTRSTVPLGANRQFRRLLEARGSSAPVVANPEFLREGRALHDFEHPDRIVVGADDLAAGEAVARLYDGLPGERILTDPVTAEMIKYAANSYLAARITFVNGLANLAGAVGADIETVTHGMGLDSRIGPEFLRPGPGYGGSCFPKDIMALIARSREAGFDFDLLEAVVAADKAQRDTIVARLVEALGGLDGRKVALWGLAFKAGTGDTRVSPAIKLANRLVNAGARVVAFDPVAVPAPDMDVEVATDPIAAATGADAVLVATEWPSFATVDLDAVRAVMSGDVIYDARNVLDLEVVRASGLRYLSLGRQF
jgi:UDPglucose 6-dehydrogenase